MTPEQHQYRSDVFVFDQVSFFIFNFDYISHLVVVFLFLSLNM